MKSTKQSLGQIAFEFLSIVFAVLLALGLNSYKQTLDLKEESNILTKKIVAECSKNAQQLDSVIYRNKEFKMYLDSLYQSKEITGFKLDFSNQLLSSSAWTFTKSSQSFQYMDDDFLDDVTELYELQAYYMDISNQMFENIGTMLLQMDNIQTRTMVRTSRYYLDNILNASNQVQETYSDFLKEYDPTNVGSD